MDHKAFKQDLTYACKKFQKEGKTLSVFADNLSIIDGKFVAEGNFLDPLEMLVLVKGYAPLPEMIRVYHETWEECKRIDTEEEEPEIYEKILHEHSYTHHEAYNIYVTDLISQQAQIFLPDVYAFLCGLENVWFEGANEFYNVGVYIREKFAPVGAHKELLRPAVFKPLISQIKTERKFVIYSFKGDTSIMEVECQPLSSTEGTFPSAKEGEWMARVVAPQSLYDKLPSGKLVPSVWCGWAFHNSAEECRNIFEKSVRSSIIRSKSKKKTKDPSIIVEVTEEEVSAIMDKVKVVLL